MKIFKVNKNDSTIEVVCESQKTRNGFRHLATLLYNGIESESVKCCYLNRTWERFEFESVLEKLARDSKVLSDKEKKVFQEFIENGNRVEDDLSPLKNIARIAKLGEIFGKNQKEANDWKARILKAGLENKGLIMPDDWNELNEDEKTKRLNGAIAQLE